VLTKGADSNARAPEHGGTALMLAAMNGKRELAELLLFNGAMSMQKAATAIPH